MALFRPVEGARYSKEELVALCEAYIYSPEFSGNVTEKEQKISLIRAKKSNILEFLSRGKGWGNSAMNPNCWIEVGRDVQPSTTSTVTKTPSPAIAPNVTGSQYNQRPWQGKYRGDLLRMWGACAVTGCRTPALLTASHIKPVIHCSPEEMIDPYNGILLSKMYDKLFDSGLITFGDDGNIVFSTHVPQADLLSLGINPNVKILFDARHFPYLAFHRSKIFKS